jgi:hypothetical protein
MLQEKTNLIEVVGTLSEVDLREGTSKTGSDYIAGTITVKTTEKINNEEKEVEIPFSVFSSKLTRKGEPNPAYTSIVGVRDNMTSIAACGDPDLATTVRVYSEKGSIRENSFYSPQTGQLVETSRPNASFFSAVPRSKYENMARFETVIFILNIDDETDRDGIPTGRLKIKGAVPGYNGVINVIDYVAESQNAVEHIKTFWNNGDTVKVFGKLNYSVEVENKEEEVGFGEKVVKKVTHSKKELLITAGSTTAFDEDEAFDREDIIAALNQRKATLEEKKEASQKKEPMKPTIDYGF